MKRTSAQFSLDEVRLWTSPVSTEMLRERDENSRPGGTNGFVVLEVTVIALMIINLNFFGSRRNSSNSHKIKHTQKNSVGASASD